MEMLTDNPISNVDQDEFGFKLFANILATSVVETNSLPFCIGIFGQWGTGKTSLMRMIEHMLKNRANIRDETIKTIWFNPWKYDQKEALWNSLIQTILYQIVEETEQRAQLREKTRKLAKSIGWLALKKGISKVSGGFITENNIDEIINSIVDEDVEHYRQFNRFENDFKRIIEEYTNGGRLVVFIDDLDRCLPENAITVLESLKLFIGDAKCVFILGMDPFVAQQGITARYGETLKLSGRDYLDKVIQVPFFLPPVPFQRLRAALSVTKTANYNNLIWKLIEIGLGGNPRKTKRFVNCFYFLKQIVESSRLQDNSNWDSYLPEIPQNLPPDVQDFYLAKLLIIQLCFDKFYDFLEVYPHIWAYIEEHLLREDFPTKDNDVFRNYPGLFEIWNDQRLRKFMVETSKGVSDDFPTSPDGEVLASLMRALNLVTTPSTTTTTTTSSSSSSSSESSLS
jgi:hypothetical protein